MCVCGGGCFSPSFGGGMQGGGGGTFLCFLNGLEKDCNLTVNNNLARNQVNDCW